MESITNPGGGNAAAAAPVQADPGGTAIIPVDNADDFIVGSDRKALDTADTTKNVRMFFDKVKGAFRVGNATTNVWDDANVGGGSFAANINTKASGVRSAAFGFETIASGNDSFASGSSSRATGAQSHAEGNSTLASSDGAHAEGWSTTASGQHSHAEGWVSTASGENCHAEGSQTTAEGSSSHAEGRRSKATRYAQWAKAAGFFSNFGDAQINNFVYRRETTDATTQVLLGSDGTVALPSGGRDTNVLTIPVSRAHTVRIEAVARRTDAAGEAAGFTWEGVVARDATGNARIVGTPVTNKWNDAAAAAWALTVQINTADATNNFLEILATGELAKTIRWVAGVYTTEVG